MESELEKKDNTLLILERERGEFEERRGCSLNIM